jgi:signal transduction histidine kinase
MPNRREQLADVRVERMRLLLKQLPIALAANVANATLVAVVLSRVQSFHTVVWWWAALVALVSVRLLSWWRLSQREALSSEELGLWQKRAFVGSLVSGTLWGGGAFFLFPAEDIYQIFFAFVVGGMAAGAAAGLSYSLPTYFAFLLPSVLPLAARYVLEGTPVDIAMGAMVVVFAVALSLIARNQHKALTTALTLQFEKSHLAEELASVLQSLEQRVEERTNDLRIANEKLTLEIAERQRAEEAERQARRDADQANTAKSVFLAAASHDLRQPVQGLRLYLEVLNRELTTEKQQELARRMTSTLDAARDLLDTLMDLSALESGKVQPAIQPCRLQDLLDHIASEAQIMAQNKGLELRIHPCPAGTAIATDRVLLSRMLRNLVTNAIRHTSEGKILVACRRRRDHLRIEVWDTGPGIAQDKLKEIFRDFYQASNPQHVLSKGLGLGLWIVARTAQLLQHEIEVRSQPGKGSVFAIKIANRIEPS